jgi:hypothetical protein
MTLARTSRFAAITAIIAVLFGLVGVLPASAQVVNPTVNITASPTTVAFNPTPGVPGTTNINVTSTNNTNIVVCVSDNGAPYVPTAISTTGGTTAAGAFPFIQAGTYRFAAFTTASAGNPTATPPVAPSCSGQLNTAAGGAAIITVGRAGPTGLVGVDDATYTVSAATIPSLSAVFGGITLPPGQDITITPTQNFPISSQFCFMSGNGATKQINLQEGQDPRITTGVILGGFLLTPAIVNQHVAQAGQNGCYAENYIVEGFYNFGLAPLGSAGSPVAGASQGSPSSFVGFCSPANQPNQVPANPFDTARHCAQVAYNATVGATIIPLPPTVGTFAGRLGVPQGTILTGAATTGGDRHAIQVCAYAVTPTGATAGTLNVFGNVAQSYNQSGSINITPFALNATSIPGLIAGTVVLLQTIDLVGSPGANGIGAPQATCGNPTFTVAGNAVTALVPPTLIGLNGQVMDQEFFIVV